MTEDLDTERKLSEIMDRDVSTDLRSALGSLHMLPEGEQETPPQAIKLGNEERVAIHERYRAIEQAILARAPEHKVQPSLERVRMALGILGDPQTTYRSVHITGTNGKTSTARMLSALLMATGRKVGRYTSPHLHSMCERISINDEPVTEAQFNALFDDVAPYLDMVDEANERVGKPRMSFFEILTVIALAGFADIPVDAAVVEVGMGGTWDATNVLDAEVAVIAPIAHDHEKWLGSTLRQIAAEKAGIVKPGSVAIVAHQEPEVMEILEQRAREVDAQLRVEGRDFEVAQRRLAVGGQMLTVRTPAAVYADVFVPLVGAHQAQNAALALAAMEAFNGGRALEGALVEEGFASATSPGRLEVVRTSPSIVVDAAHNPHGARALATALGESFDYTHMVGVYAAMADKNVEAVLSEMEPILDSIVITGMDTPRAMPAQDLGEVAVDVFGPDRVSVQHSLLDAIDQAVEQADASTDPAASNGVVVFGSVVLVGHVRDLMKEQNQRL
ncbi:folylpolyglutamate synthase/dihydrofolate synthase family protein [Gleimia hominis]|uniref:tetrahydrofolate synthase n=1 Tax=Gleimia hominis TaxID=595468 RepID=A0ABU3IC32_9ACTO|nr:folylpolyglutamate synthase/dihydrofolate synthase family protein [Gleimia hominis]MDT3767939.1 folylpolyglutamate synthase/dihydrofolate synthase family protein [Gleimia hominis]